MAYSDTYDCWSVILDDDTKELRVVFYKYARKERIFFDKELEKENEIFEKLGADDAESGVVKSTDDDQEKKEIKPLRFETRTAELKIRSDRRYTFQG